MSPFIVLWGASTRAKQVGTLLSRNKLPWVRLVAARMSFFTWVFALPRSTADSLDANMGWLKVAALVLVALVISGLAQRYYPAPALVEHPV